MSPMIGEALLLSFERKNTMNFTREQLSIIADADADMWESGFKNWKEGKRMQWS